MNHSRGQGRGERGKGTFSCAESSYTISAVQVAVKYSQWRLKGAARWKAVAEERRIGFPQPPRFAPLTGGAGRAPSSLRQNSSPPPGGEAEARSCARHYCIRFVWISILCFFIQLQREEESPSVTCIDSHEPAAGRHALHVVILGFYCSGYPCWVLCVGSIM
jgi:hypothetical protein